MNIGAWLDCSPWTRKESGITERLRTHIQSHPYVLLEISIFNKKGIVQLSNFWDNFPGTSAFSGQVKKEDCGTKIWRGRG